MDTTNYLTIVQYVVHIEAHNQKLPNFSMALEVGTLWFSALWLSLLQLDNFLHLYLYHARLPFDPSNISNVSENPTQLMARRINDPSWVK